MGNMHKAILTTEARQEQRPQNPHANILLAVDELENVPLTEQEDAWRFYCHINTVANIS